MSTQGVMGRSDRNEEAIFFFEKQAVFVRLCAYGVRELIVRKNTTAPAAKSGVCGNGVVI